MSYHCPLVSIDSDKKSAKYLIGALYYVMTFFPCCFHNFLFSAVFQHFDCYVFALSYLAFCELLGYVDEYFKNKIVKFSAIIFSNIFSILIFRNDSNYSIELGMKIFPFFNYGFMNKMFKLICLNFLTCKGGWIIPIILYLTHWIPVRTKLNAI